MMCSGIPRSDRARRLGRGVTRLVLAAALAALAWGAVPAEPPRRICSVSLAGDEMLALLVPPERVVCVSAMADDRAMSNVAGHYPQDVPRLTARIEGVVAARPDLVVAAPWNRGGFLDLLERSRIPWAVLEPVVTFDDIRAELRRVGRLVGREDRAETVIEDMDRRLGRVARCLESVRERGELPRVLSFSHMIVAGRGTTVDTLIRAAAARNAADGWEGHRKLSMEQLLSIDPDVLLLGFEGGADASHLYEAYPHLSALRAVREGRVIVLPPRQLTTVTPHLVEGVEVLAGELHPEAMSGEGCAPPAAAAGPGTRP